ncbi:MAG: hypothetical protein QOH33_1385 [Paraburkholderia sp.]|nr:hypothetical protein [Paraburkholderia sp.]
MSGGNKIIGRVVLALSLSVAILSGLAIPSAARAEAAPADPIDTAMRDCLARADRSSPPGQAQCMDAARGSWQAAIDAAFRSLTANAPDKVKRGWQESQRRWFAWRDVETPLVRAVFATTHGSSYVITEANVLLQPVRDRALQLRGVAARSQAQVSASAAGAPDPAPRVRPCMADAACEHAQFDLNRYARKLRAKLPVPARALLARSQRAWRGYLEVTAALGSEADRVDLIGARVATLKRLSETVGND